MKMASSQTTLFDQFHTNASYMEWLSCFMYKMNCKHSCLGINFKRHPIQMQWSLVNPKFEL
jgi:hypothetical protein